VALESSSSYKWLDSSDCFSLKGVTRVGEELVIGQIYALGTHGNMTSTRTLLDQLSRVSSGCGMPLVGSANPEITGLELRKRSCHFDPALTTLRKGLCPCLVMLCLGAFITITGVLTSSPVFADTESDLTRLEIKFFQHNYPKDTEPARLERLEKMVFGEIKSGGDGDRLAKLIEAVPVSDTPPSDAAVTGGAGHGASAEDLTAGQPTPSTTSRKGRRAQVPVTSQSNPGDNDLDAPVKTDEKYPAVTAIEQKVLGKDFAGEPVEKRLARLETKEFGKPSSSSMDLSDRVDALKQKTGIDVARLAPKGSDWSDDDDDIAVSPSHRTPVSSYSGSGSSPGEDGRSFSGRDLRQDFQKAFGTSGGYGGGNYGFSGSSAGSSAASGVPSGSYGMGGGGGSSYPSTPSSFRGSNRSAPPVVIESQGGMGLNQQVSALETEIFQKTYSHDPLPTRLNRLEATVFPSDKSLSDKSLPDRVANLVAKIPISTPGSSRKVARANKDDELDNLMNGGTPSISTSQQQVPSQQKSSGLGKIISSIGNMLTGGGMGYTGGYPMNGGALATDPTTGLLYDPSTGNLIDPNTGAVVARRAPVYNNGYGYGTGYGASPYGYGGFNNGFSQFGTINRGFGPSFGFGGGGMRMGGMGGMWP